MLLCSPPFENFLHLVMLEPLKAAPFDLVIEHRVTLHKCSRRMMRSDVDGDGDEMVDMATM